MSKKALVVIVLIVLAGAGILVAQNHNKMGDLDTEITKATNASALSGNVSVDISGYSFKQPVIKVKKGTVITWTNRDNAPHTVTSSEGTFLDSIVLRQGDTYQKTMDTVGTYKYHCKPHPQMLAAIIVIE